jgi:hypothetical protein
MTVTRKRKKVKQKERILRQKRQLRQASKKRAQRKKKRGKKSRRKKPQLVVNTNAELKRLRKQVAAQKKKIAALRRRPKAERKREGKKKAEPGTLLSPRGEAARKGWTTRRAKQAERLKEFLSPDESRLTQDERDELEKLAKRGLQNRKQLIATYVKKLPDYLIRKDKEEFLVERKENMIMHRLIIAKEIVGNFDDTAYDIAEEYDLEPYEVYSLWHGYELEE